MLTLSGLKKFYFLPNYHLPFRSYGWIRELLGETDE